MGYNARKILTQGIVVMSTKTAVLDSVLDEVITEEFAKHLVSYRANDEMQTRLHELGDKCTEGTLTSKEREEYEGFVSAFNLVSLLQAKAHRVLNQVAH